MPKIHEIPQIYCNKKHITKYFTEEQFMMCFPYAKASSVYTDDNKPFWRYSDFIQAIYWLNLHPNPIYHNFGTESDDDTINLLELASFLGNFHQECGDPSLEAPYPWSYPKSTKKGLPYEGPAGGALAIMEGCNSEISFGSNTFSAELSGPLMVLSDIEKKVIQTDSNIIQGVVRTLKQLNQPQFGLGMGTGNGAVFLPGYISVSDDGTLWGDIDDSQRQSNIGYINPTSEYKQLMYSDRKYSSLGPYSQYGGRGAIQLSYNYNYTDCSLALFGDYRLVKYPNLIITTNRITFNNMPYYFGFPGINPNGNNQLPDIISKSTPPARILAWLVCFWFWMDRNRSGRTLSCHQAMLSPYTHGITTCNMIINNQSGCSESWAAKKVSYYKRICKILSIPDDIVTRSIICPPHSDSIRK